MPWWGSTSCLNVSQMLRFSRDCNLCFFQLYIDPFHMIRLVVCDSRLSFWRMKTTADATISVHQFTVKFEMWHLYTLLFEYIRQDKNRIRLVPCRRTLWCNVHGLHLQIPTARVSINRTSYKKITQEAKIRQVSFVYCSRRKLNIASNVKGRGHRRFSISNILACMFVWSQDSIRNIRVVKYVDAHYVNYSIRLALVWYTSCTFHQEIQACWWHKYLV
jgi:hypothetical protein